MGNFWDNSEIKRDEVEKNIAEVNDITKSVLFMNKNKMFLFFKLEDTPIQKISKKIIKVEVHKYDDKSCMIENKKKSLFITIDNFYNYFNLLMNVRKVFLNERMKDNMDKLRRSFTMGNFGKIPNDLKCSFKNKKYQGYSSMVMPPNDIDNIVIKNNAYI